MRNDQGLNPIRFYLWLGVMFFLFVLLQFSPLHLTKEKLTDFFMSMRNDPWGGPVFILFYGLGSTIAFPSSLFALLGGAVFGFKMGFFYNVIASNLGASFGFLMARYFGHDFVKGLVKKNRLGFVAEKMRSAGFSTILRLRCLPFVPFNVFSFSAGFSSVKFWDYFWGSFFGMLPGSLLCTYFADAMLSGVTEAHQWASVNLVLSSVLLMTIAFAPSVYRKVKSRRMMRLSNGAA